MERLAFSGDSTPHGMRATFSTHFNANGAGIHVIEHCLSHVPGNRVRAAYNRYAHPVERRTVLQGWADHVDHLCTGLSANSRSPIAPRGSCRTQPSFKVQRASEKKTLSPLRADSPPSFAPSCKRNGSPRGNGDQSWRPVIADRHRFACKERALAPSALLRIGALGGERRRAMPGFASGTAWARSCPTVRPTPPDDELPHHRASHLPTRARLRASISCTGARRVVTDGQTLGRTGRLLQAVPARREFVRPDTDLPEFGRAAIRSGCGLRQRRLAQRTARRDPLVQPTDAGGGV